jgi:hypothetical protein
MRDGSVDFIKLESQAGAMCKLRNPFLVGADLYRDGRKAETLHGPMLEFKTRKGERIVLLASGSPSAKVHRKAKA